MRFRLFAFLFFTLLFGWILTGSVYAVENPFSSFNNKFGIHILFPQELSAAADLVNSSGGDWGYVTIPIQSGDKDLEKWQNFMDSAKKLHIIPIIRLATEGDYFNTKVWRKPNEDDILDFANFLNSLTWPVKNRYIVVYNEVNRADEWGGSVNADDYTKLLAYTVNVFKSKSQDFFIISAGLDNAAPNKLPQYENEYDFLNDMNEAVPGIFSQIDGISSHSYPNPAFSQPPTNISRNGVMSFDFERKLIKSFSGRDVPVFITETGWSTKAILDLTAADYYQRAFKTVWSDNGVVAVTPFLLRANGAFEDFSFIAPDGSQTYQYRMVKSIPKVRGLPALVKNSPNLLQAQKKVLGLQTSRVNINVAEASSYRDFSRNKETKKIFSVTDMLMGTFSWLVAR